VKSEASSHAYFQANKKCPSVLPARQANHAESVSRLAYFHSGLIISGRGEEKVNVGVRGREINPQRLALTPTYLVSSFFGTLRENRPRDLLIDRPGNSSLDDYNSSPHCR
jgi:hypothetical protein